MTPHRWRRIEGLFARALELPEEGRAAFLAAASDGDDGLAREVERLFAADARATTFLEPPAWNATAEGSSSFALDLSGRRVRELTLQREIGRGRTAIVYRATQAGHDRPVAVRLLPPRLRLEAAVLERFRREALVASRLRHPGIARALESGEERGFHYCAMEYVDGWSLRRMLDGGGRGRRPGVDLSDFRVCARIARDVAEALAYSHARGVLHTRVEPSKVLIARADGAARVIGFGRARALDLVPSREEDAASTSLYTSPEQVRALQRQVDPRTDVYSAGVLLYELLTARSPFAAERRRRAPRPPVQAASRVIRTLPPEVPRDLAAVCLKAVRHEREGRYASAVELADDLARFLERRRVLARPGVAVRVRDRLLGR